MKATGRIRILMSLCILGVIAGGYAGADGAPEGWHLRFSDDFEREQIGKAWRDLGSFRIENGVLTGNGEIVILVDFAGDQRLEYTCWAPVGQTISDLAAVLCSANGKLGSGYFFGFGSELNTQNKFLRATNLQSEMKGPLIVPGKKHRVVCQRDGYDITWWIDGKKVLAWYDPSPLPEKRIGFYLYLDGFIDDVKVYTRQKSTLLQGAEYLDDSATGRASDEELKVFEALLPKCAEPTPEGVQPVAQVKHRGKPFFAIGFYGDIDYMPLVPTSLKELMSNGVNCLITRDVVVSVSEEMAAKNPSLRERRELQLKETARELKQAEEAGFVLYAELGPQLGGLYPHIDGTMRRLPDLIEYNVKKLRESKAVGGFYLYDEPGTPVLKKYGLLDELPSVTDWSTPARVKAVQEEVSWYYNEVKQYAPDLPLLNCYTRAVATGMDGYDIHNTCIYPIKSYINYPFNKLYLTTQFARETALACKLYGGGKKSFNFSPQAYDRDHPRQGQGNLIENRYCAYGPITQGAQGIIYWCLWWATRDNLEKNLFPITRELDKLSPYLLGEWKNQLVVSDHDETTWGPLNEFKVRDPLCVREITPLGDISHCVRKKDDEYMVITVNNTMFPKEVTYSMNIPGLKGRTLEVEEFIEGEMDTIVSGKLKTKLVPFGTKVWIIKTN
jgi:hypothetical protein